jgi:hypothetical protein
MNGVKAQANISHRRLVRRSSSSGIAAVFAGAALVAAVAVGCESKSPTEPAGTSAASGTSAATTAAGSSADAAQVLRDSSATTAVLHSVHVALAATDVESLPMQSVNADVTNQPQGKAQAVGDASIRMKQGGPFVSAQFLVTDRTLYTKEADGTYTLVGPAEKVYDPGIILNPEKGLPNVIRSVQNPKVEGNETINGVAAVKVSGTVDASVIDPVVPKLGADGGTLPVTLWVKEAPAATGPSPTADVKPTGTGANLVRMLIDKGKGSVDITLSMWDEPVTIPNPAG